MSKRILIFSLAYYPHVGGAEVAIKEITDRIEDIEFSMVTMRFCTADVARERIGNVEVYRVGNGNSYLSKILFIPRAAALGLQLHRIKTFDGAWAMMSYMVFPLVLMRMRGVRIPYVLNLQDGDPFERVFNRWFILPLRPLLMSGFRNATVMQTLSSYLAQWARAAGYRGKIEVIPNGADTKRFLEAHPADIGKSEGDTWLVTSSRLVHKNAVDVVIRALALLPAHTKFLILGAGQDEMMLKTLASELNVEKRVLFKGYVPHRELPGYLHAADIFVRPSRSEGFGASFAEAMAAGLPIIATQEGGIADFLFDAKRSPEKEPTGWAVDKDSPEQIADAVNRILSDPAGAARVVANARRLAEEKYDWNGIARAMQERVFSRLFAS